jgi:putative salt-induced outer membrane protein
MFLKLKRKKIFVFLFLLAVLVCDASVFAQERSTEGIEPAVEKAEKRWGGEGELGYISTSGNTETSSLNAKLDIAYRHDSLSHKLSLEALFSEDSGETTSERYVGAFKSEYELTERGYLFGKAEYLDDRFAGYDYQITEVAGYGRQIMDTGTVALSLESGPGGRHSRTTEGDREDELVFYAGGEFSWQFSKTASLGEELAVEVGEESTQSESVTSLKTDIIGNLGMKVSYTVRNNSSPPEDSRSTDTIFSVTLVYGF